MTTSQTMHNALLAMSRKARKRTQERKPTTKDQTKKNSARIVELARAVFQSSSHHITRPTSQKTQISPAAVVKDEEKASPSMETKETGKSSGHGKSETKAGTKDATACASTSEDNSPTAANNDDGLAIYDSYYAKLHKQLKEEIAQMEEKRKEVVQKQVGFWDEYKYGLEKISTLNDLRDAPDAIMAGNFPPPAAEDEEKAEQRDSKSNETEEVSTNI